MSSPPAWHLNGVTGYQLWQFIFSLCVRLAKKSQFQGGYVIIIWDEGTMNRRKNVYKFKTIFCLVGHNF